MHFVGIFVCSLLIYLRTLDTIFIFQMVCICVCVRTQTAKWDEAVRIVNSLVSFVFALIYASLSIQCQCQSVCVFRTMTRGKRYKSAQTIQYSVSLKITHEQQTSIGTCVYQAKTTINPFDSAQHFNHTFCENLFLYKRTCVLKLHRFLSVFLTKSTDLKLSTWMQLKRWKWWIKICSCKISKVVSVCSLCSLNWWFFSFQVKFSVKILKMFGFLCAVNFHWPFF